MSKLFAFALGFLFALAGDGSSAMAASAACSNCIPEGEITIREQIKADRARDLERTAKETTDRPWDGKDFGRAKRSPSAPPVR
jgi:hypothetical protein